MSFNPFDGQGEDELDGEWMFVDNQEYCCSHFEDNDLSTNAGPDSDAVSEQPSNSKVSTSEIDSNRHFTGASNVNCKSALSPTSPPLDLQACAQLPALDAPMGPSRAHQERLPHCSVDGIRAAFLAQGSEFEHRFMGEHLGCFDISLTTWMPCCQMPGTLVRTGRCTMPVPQETSAAVASIAKIPEVSRTRLAWRFRDFGDHGLAMVCQSCSDDVPFGTRFRVQEMLFVQPHPEGGVALQKLCDIVWVEPLPWTMGFVRSIIEEKTAAHSMASLQPYARILGEIAMAATDADDLTGIVEFSPSRDAVIDLCEQSSESDTDAVSVGLLENSRCPTPLFMDAPHDLEASVQLPGLQASAWCTQGALQALLPNSTIDSVRAAFLAEGAGFERRYMQEELQCFDISLTAWMTCCQMPGTLVRTGQCTTPVPQEIPAAVARIVKMPEVSRTKLSWRFRDFGADGFAIVCHSCCVDVPFGTRFRVQEVLFAHPHSEGGVALQKLSEVVWVEPLSWTMGFVRNTIEEKTAARSMSSLQAYARILGEVSGS